MTKISEELLYYVWNLKRFDTLDLKTTQGDAIQIKKWGTRNHNSGPDFLQAQIKIGDQLWAGHVEMHIRASDWHKHGHHEDPAFQNVILHVVYHSDDKIRLPNNESLHCLELKKRIDPGLVQTYQQLLASQAWIPCAANTRSISSLSLQSWYERLLVERLSLKTAKIQRELDALENDWEEVFYRLMARNFGFKVNGDAFYQLAARTPRKLLIKHKDRLRDIEALLFGQAGFLEGHFEDDYPKSLQNQYVFFKRKYQLQPMTSHLWKFMRMRPANFPTIRIAQLSILLFKSEHLFSKVLAAANYREILHLFSSDVSSYWKTHYTLEKETASKSKKLGRSSLDLITINTIVPILFHYGQFHRQDKFCSKALQLLDQIKAEKNHIIGKFAGLDFPVKSALDSQALLQLKSNYCDQKKCLSCAIGGSILKPNPARN